MTTTDRTKGRNAMQDILFKAKELERTIRGEGDMKSLIGKGTDVDSFEVTTKENQQVKLTIEKTIDDKRIIQKDMKEIEVLPQMKIVSSTSPKEKATASREKDTRSRELFLENEKLRQDILAKDEIIKQLKKREREKESELDNIKTKLEEKNRYIAEMEIALQKATVLLRQKLPRSRTVTMSPMSPSMRSIPSFSATAKRYIERAQSVRRSPSLSSSASYSYSSPKPPAKGSPRSRTRRSIGHCI